MDEHVDSGSAREPAAPIRIFRKADSPLLEHAGTMTTVPPPPADQARAGEALAAGMGDGGENRVLFSAPGFSLTHVWFKSGYPLPRHSHDVDCLYCVIAGSLTLGRDTLGSGDGFFIGAGTPYTYTAGPDGVELLEFRTREQFDIRLLMSSDAAWNRIIETARSRHSSWLEEPPPSGR